MLGHAWQISSIPVTDGFRQCDRNLTPVIGTKGRCHWNTPCLTERVILHRADEVDRNLRDLNRRALRQKPEKDDNDHFDHDKQRIPANKLQLFDAAG